MARARDLEAKERNEIRQSLEEDHLAHRPHSYFPEDPDASAAARIIAHDEEQRIGLTDENEDNVDLRLDDDHPDDDAKPAPQMQYHDYFTDDDFDVFKDGDGAGGDVYDLHSHVKMPRRRP